MHRKDVKIGFAIGSAVLFVLIIWAIAKSGDPGNTQVTLADDPPAQVQPVEQGDKPEPPTGDDAQNDSARAGGPEAQPPQPADANDPWTIALNLGKLEADKVPYLISSTPDPNAGRAATPTAGEENASLDPAPTDAAIAQDPFGNREDTGPAGASVNVAGSMEQHPGSAIAGVPATQPESSAPAATRTHVVQHGETFTSIAQMVYGNGAYYPHILRANPSIDPKKLRPGMTIVLPDVDQVVAPANAPDGAQRASVQLPAIDESREYRVQPNDSLYKIALKLYGKAEKMDAIYEMNKDAIGSNRSHLKVGMILKLPEPPTTTNASR